MSILCDFHMHSAFSNDSDAPMEDMVLAAIQKGLKIICFTEHIDLDFPCEEGEYTVDMPRYYEEILRLRELYGAALDIRFGIELGMQPHLCGRYVKIAAEYPFDFIAASQHLTRGEDPYYPSFWTDRDEARVYRNYFLELLSNLKNMEDYDTAAHLDYIVRYGPTQNTAYSWQSYGEYIEPLLEYIIAQNKCLEVNTAGLKYGLGHPNPDEFVLKKYREMGGKRITIGSDAHKPEHVAYDFDAAEKILKNLGFETYTVFRRREAEELSL